MLSSSVKNMDISVFHLNIRSLNKNHVNLFTFLQLLNIQFDIIVLSEIWNYNLDFYHTLLRTTRFTMIHLLCQKLEVLVYLLTMCGTVM